MIVTQFPYIDKNYIPHSNLIKHYSDNAMYIRQVETGIIYTEAVDVFPCRYTYEETDTPIENITIQDSIQ